MRFQSYQGKPVWGVQASTFQEMLALRSHDHADYWVTYPHYSSFINVRQPTINHIPGYVMYFFFHRDLVSLFAYLTFKKVKQNFSHMVNTLALILKQKMIPLGLFCVNKSALVVLTSRLWHSNYSHWQV